MELCIYRDKQASGAAAAECTVHLVQQAIRQRGAANIIVATGASQFEMFSHIITLAVDWSKVTVFHLDEYIGLPISHPASFRRYLKQRFVDKLPELHQFHEINAEGDPLAECRRLGDLIRRSPVDVACVGIGENGHLAFNDPPADFDTHEPYIVVNLDAACRQQQVGEGWFAALQEVPQQAISMSIRQIMKSDAIVCLVPDARKASAVQKTVEGPLTNLVPASILQQHPRCWLFLDVPAAAGLTRRL